MTSLTLEAKEAIITRALSRQGISLKQIAKESNISDSTLKKWLRCKREGIPLPEKQGSLLPQAPIPPLQHLLATAGLDEQGVGVYCRQQGIHRFQLNRWQEELMKNTGTKTLPPKSSAELTALRSENKQLKKELQRKEKALAETAALLVLKKKADLIWEELGDD